MNSMPIINMDLLTGEAEMFAKAISKPVQTSDGPARQIYATKPKNNWGDVKYVWRMVVFVVSRKRQHQCMPVTAEWNLTGDYLARCERAKELDAIVDEIVNTIPKSQWYGVHRWARLL